MNKNTMMRRRTVGHKKASFYEAAGGNLRGQTYPDDVWCCCPLEARKHEKTFFASHFFLSKSPSTLRAIYHASLSFFTNLIVSWQYRVQCIKMGLDSRRSIFLDSNQRSVVILACLLQAWILEAAFYHKLRFALKISESHFLCMRSGLYLMRSMNDNHAIKFAIGRIRSGWHWQNNNCELNMTGGFSCPLFKGMMASPDFFSSYPTICVAWESSR